MGWSDVRDAFTGRGIRRGWDSITGASSARRAAGEAAETQAEYYGQAIDETRRQHDALIERMLPFLQRGTDAIGYADEAMTPGGLDERLGQIFSSDSFGRLQDERMRTVQNQLNQTGMRRSGAGLEEVASVPTDLGMAIEQMLYGRQMDAIGSGQNAAAGMGTAGMNSSANISQLLSGQGDALAQGIIGGQQASAAANQQGINTAMTIGSLLFSDPRLKKNIVQIGQIKDLNFYQWDWVDGVSDLVGRISLGFLTDEVKEKYPQFVHEVHGFDAIDYQGLTEHLEAA